MNILVTGANGQLGQSLRDLVSTNHPSASGHTFHFTDVDTLDITDSQAVDTAVAGNDIVINCAAFTDVDGAEDQPELARLLNVTAPGILARAARKSHSLLVHISTDYVFGGYYVNTPIAENAPTAPTGVYGMTKSEGEKNVMASGADYLILRTAWLYSKYGKNFVKTILNLLRSRDEIKVVYDQVGTPTYAPDLAVVILSLINQRLKKETFNFTDQGVISWYDFARAIQEISGLDKCHISPCRSSEFPSKVKRPSYSVLDKAKISSALNSEPPYWRDSLKQCLSHANL